MNIIQAKERFKYLNAHIRFNENIMISSSSMKREVIGGGLEQFLRKLKLS